MLAGLQLGRGTSENNAVEKLALDRLAESGWLRSGRLFNTGSLMTRTVFDVLNKKEANGYPWLFELSDVDAIVMAWKQAASGQQATLEILPKGWLTKEVIFSHPASDSSFFYFIHRDWGIYTIFHLHVLFDRLFKESIITALSAPVIRKIFPDSNLNNWGNSIQLLSGRLFPGDRDGFTTRLNGMVLSESASGALKIAGVPTNDCLLSVQVELRLC